jgi:hypothetical protein
VNSPAFRRRGSLCCSRELSRWIFGETQLPLVSRVNNRICHKLLLSFLNADTEVQGSGRIDIGDWCLMWSLVNVGSTTLISSKLAQSNHTCSTKLFRCYQSYGCRTIFSFLNASERRTYVRHPIQEFEHFWFVTRHF